MGAQGGLLLVFLKRPLTGVLSDGLSMKRKFKGQGVSFVPINQVFGNVIRRCRGCLLGVITVSVRMGLTVRVVVRVRGGVQVRRLGIIRHVRRSVPSQHGFVFVISFCLFHS